MAFNKKFFTTGGIVASSGACLTENVNPFTGTSGDNGKALYSMDYDASDASGSHNGTPSNVDFGVSGQVSFGARFNGTNSKIDTTATLIPTGATDNFSVAFWLKPNNQFGTILARGLVTASNVGYGFRIAYRNTTGQISCDRLTGGAQANEIQARTPNSVITQGSWNHVVLVYDSSANTITYYINKSLVTTSYVNQNGSSVSGPMSSGAIAFNGSFDGGVYRIGNRNNSLSNSFYSGDLDQLRVFSSTLTQEQAFDIYNEQACVHTSTTDIVDFPLGTTNLAYYKLDNSAEDSKGTNDGTETDIEYRFGRYGQAAVFNGSSSIIALPSSSPFGDDDTIKSISAWVKLSTTSSIGVVYTVSSSTNSSDYFTMQVRGDLNKVFITSRNGSSSNSFLDEVAITPDTNWHHYVFQLGSTEREIYIDGVKKTLTKSNAGTATNTSWISYPVYDNTIHSDIGLGRRSSAYYSAMTLDQVRMFSTAISQANVTSLFEEKPETDTSNFKAVLYKGTAANQYISNVGMDLETSGGLVWIKNRTTNYSHVLIDSVRGVSLELNSNDTSADYTETSGVTSLEKNGFFLGSLEFSYNKNNDNYVAWVWKGGGAAASNTDGANITSFVSANVSAGFSIVKWTGDGNSSSSVGHGLTVNSENMLVFIKDRDNGSSDWMVITNNLWTTPQQRFLKLTNAAVDTSNANIYNVDNTTFKNAYRNVLNNDYIAYCFHSVSGYQKIGSYTGDGSTSGKIIYTTDDGTSSGSNGFKPSFLLTKPTGPSGGYWYLLDNRRSTTNPRNDALFPNDSLAEIENTNYNVDFLSNGFELKNNTIGFNEDNENYIFLAIK